MRVRNIAVTNDFEYFEETLIKYLIVNEISYVQVENEFHFSDNIYRLFDYSNKESMEILINSPGQTIVVYSPESLISIEDSFNFKRSDNLYVEAPGRLEMPTKERKTYSKKMVKAHNRMINQTIKNYNR